MSSSTKKKNNDFVLRTVIAILAILVSLAVIVLGIVVDTRYSSSIVSVNTSFLVLIIAEFFFVLSYISWSLIKYHNLQFFRRFYSADDEDDNISYREYLTYHASSYSRQLIFTYFSFLFSLISLGAGVAIICTSVSDFYNNRDAQDIFIIEAYEYILPIFALVIVSQFLKGVLIAIDLSTVIISYYKFLIKKLEIEESINNEISNFSINDDNSTVGSDYENNNNPNNTDQHNFQNSDSNTSKVSTSGKIYRNDSQDFSDIGYKNHRNVKYLSIFSNPFPKSAKITTTEVDNYNDSMNNTINVAHKNFSSSKNVKKVTVSNGEQKSTFSHANATPPLSQNNSFIDKYQTLEEENIDYKKRAPRSRSALSQRSNRKQLSPIKEPSARIFEESPSRKSGVAKRHLNELLLDNYQRDFNQMLKNHEKDLNGKSSFDESKEVTFGSNVNYQWKNTSQDSSRKSSRDSSPINVNFDPESIEKYKRVLNNRKSSRNSNSSGSKLRLSSGSVIPSSPPPILSDFEEQKQYTDKLKPLHLANQLSARNSFASTKNTPDKDNTSKASNISANKKMINTHEAISPISWESNYDPLYDNDLQEIPTIPTNTLWPFNRHPSSPTMSSYGRFSQNKSPGGAKSPIIDTGASKEEVQIEKDDLKNNAYNDEEQLNYPTVSFIDEVKNSNDIKESNETVCTDLILSDFKFPVDAKKLNFSESPASNIINDNNDIPQRADISVTGEVLVERNRSRTNLLKRKYRSRSLSPQKKSQPLLSYGNAEINILNNHIRGAKRKSLLKTNLSEPSSPKKKRNSDTLKSHSSPLKTSPLKILGTSFHEPKRSTVIFEDDFNFEMDRDLMIFEDPEISIVKPLNVGQKNDSEERRRSVSPKRVKNFSISSIKQVINHLHTKSLSISNNQAVVIINEEIDNHNRHKSLNAPILNAEPVDNNDWYFTNRSSAQLSDKQNDSLIYDVVENPKNYDFKASGSSNTISQNNSTLSRQFHEVSDLAKFNHLNKSSSNPTTPGITTSFSTGDIENLTKRQSFKFNKDFNITNPINLSKLDFSDKSLLSDVPSGYVGEYDKEKWMAINNLTKKLV